MIHEDNQVFNLKKTDMLSRMSEVLGKNVGDGLLPINEENAVFKVSGYLGNFDIVRKSRGEQFFFVNSRFINDRTLSAAVLSGYGELLPKGRFPIIHVGFDEAETSARSFSIIKQALSNSLYLHMQAQSSYS